MNFTVSNYQFQLPGEWHEADKVAISKELPGVAGYWKQQTETYLLQLVIQEVPAEHIDYLQPFDVDTVVKRGHEQMDETRGLIEVSVVKATSGREMLRTILKESLNHRPMYVARLQHKNDDGSGFVVQLIGKEVGMTGARESIILASHLPQEMLKTTDPTTGETITQGAPIPGWAADPYDPSYTKGFLMNKSEDPMFDQQFPKHPLSVLRADLELIQSTLSENQTAVVNSRNEDKAIGVPDDQIHDKSSKEAIDIFAPKERYVHLPWIPSKRFTLPVIVMFAYRRKRDKSDVDMVPSMWFAKDYKTRMLTAAGHTAVIRPMPDFKAGKVEVPSVMYTYEQATDAWNKHIGEITRGYFDDSDLSLSHEAISTVYLGMSAIIPPEYFAWYTQYHKDFFDYLSIQLNKEDKVD